MLCAVRRVQSSASLKLGSLEEFRDPWNELFGYYREVARTDDPDSFDGYPIPYLDRHVHPHPGTDDIRRLRRAEGWP